MGDDKGKYPCPSKADMKIVGMWNESKRNTGICLNTPSSYDITVSVSHRKHGNR
jgi:hypothetical protein